MKKLRLGNTDVEISCMGLGTMYFGSKTDEQTSFSILDCYFNHGGSFLDSANKYASWFPGFIGGESETLIGKWIRLKRNRENLFIASKVGFPYGNIPRSLKKEIVVSECEKSLKRMGIETIDLFFAHAYDENTPPEETMEAFYLLKKTGKIRFAGVSNFYGWQLIEANSTAQMQEWEGFCCIQQRHSFLEPSLRADFGTQLLLTPEIQNLCLKKNISIMAYSPLLGGIYSKPDVGLHIQYQSYTNEVRLSRIRELAGELNIPVNSLVLAWMMQGSPAVIPITAASSVSQLEENFKSLIIRLTSEQMKYLSSDIGQPNKYS